MRVKFGWAVTVACLAVATGGCSGDDSPPDDAGPKITAEAVQAGLLQPTNIGKTWTQASPAPPTTTLVAFCGGGATRVPVPPTPATLGASLVDKGKKGAQAFDQFGLVYPDTDAAGTALDSLQATAAACPPTVSQPEQPRDGGTESAYTETLTTSPLNSGGWSGFVVVRHKKYDDSNPGTADTAVAVLSQRNAVVVAAYAIYWVGAPDPGSDFAANWKRLVGSVLTRVDAAAPK